MPERIQMPFARRPRTVQYETGPWSAGALAVIGGGAMLTSADTAAFGWASIVIGVGLLLWGVRINGMHLLQPWYLGRPNPFRVKAWSLPVTYDDGADVGGITWRNGYSRVRVSPTNVSETAIDDVSAWMAPDQPIIESRAGCEFAECRIASALPKSEITLRVTLKDGTETNISELSPLVQVTRFNATHRMTCERLPAGSTIDISLATVVPDETSQYMYRQEAVEPQSLDIQIEWHVNGDVSADAWRYNLSDEE